MTAKTVMAGKELFCGLEPLDCHLQACYPWGNWLSLTEGQNMQQGASGSNEVTLLLQAWGNGDKEALDRLTPLIFQEVHRIAKRLMAGQRPNHTLQATALVNEAYLRLVDAQHASWQDRAHFFALCARAMRQILVDHARSRDSMKRGGGQVFLKLEEGLAAGSSPDANILQLDDALKRLAARDHRKSQVIELRFFGGLSVEETAEALKISPETVQRDWKLARAWLYGELSGNKEDG
jgi:RNA polymerase sigma factor (TIGR02999 family)